MNKLIQTIKIGSTGVQNTVGFVNDGHKNCECMKEIFRF